jgi:hypothetical protein
LKEETFVNYGHFSWLWFSVLSVLSLSVIYMWDDPVGGPSGGTVLGYTYGAISAAGIVFLMWYGMRKRASYHAKFSTLRGWLAAHIWIGIALAFIVPLHAGFSFGMNVHTLAYVLMLLTIITGVWGAFFYARLPPQMKARRDGLTLKSCFDQIEVITNDMGTLAKDRSDSFQKLLNRLDFPFKPTAISCLRGQKVQEVDRKTLGELLSGLPKEEHDTGLKLISLAHRKVHICNQLMDETRLNALLKVWLYFHIPIAFGCLAALVVHIVSVFYYW